MVIVALINLIYPKTLFSDSFPLELGLHFFSYSKLTRGPAFKLLKFRKISGLKVV